MSVFLNDCDVLLDEAPIRVVDPRAGRAILLDFDTATFHIDTAGNPIPAVAKFSARLIGIKGAATFSAVGASLTGADDNVRYLPASSMSGVSAEVTVTLLYEGETYTDSKKISRVSDGAKGESGTDADVTPESLLTALEGRITKSQLFADLKAEINLITDPVSVAGSVQARVQAETTNRVAAIAGEAQQRAYAISQEVSDRIAAVLGEANARSTYVQGYTYSKQETTQALSIQATQIAAAYTTYTDQKTAQAVTTAEADVRTYGYSKATVDSSIAASESRLRAEFVGAGGATEAYVTNYAYSKAYIDGAEAAQFSTLTTNYQGYATAKSADAVAGIVIGGRNFIIDSQHIFDNPNNTGLGLSVLRTDEATPYYRITASAGNISTFSLGGSYPKIPVGTVCTMSSEVRIATAGSVTGASGTIANSVPANKWTRISNTFTYDGGTLYGGHTYAGNQLDYRNYKLEIGNKATDWTPSPDDVSADIAAAVVTAAADVRSYTYSKSAIDSAEASQSSTLTANFSVRADAARDAAISAASADVRNYSYAKSTVDSAIAASESRLRSEFVSSGGATEGFVTNYAYSKSQIDQSEALQSSTLTTNFQNYANDRKTEAIVQAEADVRNYTYAKSALDGAFASQSSAITAAYTSYADSGKAQAIAAAAADIRNYSHSKATIDGAIAQSTSSLTTTVGGHTATLQTQATSINGLSAQYTVKIDSNGRFSGFGLASAPVNGVTYSIFAINADAFAVGAPGVADKTMFTVGQVNGQTQMVLRGDALFDGAVTARMLRIGSFDNIMPDPQFRDLGWWGRIGAPVGSWAASGQATVWKGGASMYLFANGGVLRDTFTQSFQQTPGATYLFEFQASVTSDFIGEVSLSWLSVDEAFIFASNQDNRGPWPDGPAVGQIRGWTTGSAAGVRNYSATATLSINGNFRNQLGQIRITDRISQGSFEWGSLSITRMSDNTLITDQGITTPKLATRAVVADKIESDAIQTRHVSSDTMEARHLKSDVVQARHMTANSIVTDSIIANGISSLDKFSNVNEAIFTSVRDFTMQFTVFQDSDETGPTGWYIQRGSLEYVNQNPGLGTYIAWHTIYSFSKPGVFVCSDTLALEASNQVWPAYRFAPMPGTYPLNVALLKVYR